MSAQTRRSVVNPLLALNLTTIGLTAILALPYNPQREFLFIQNPASATTNLGVTLDGGPVVASIPVIGNSGTITLQPGQGMLFDTFVPSGEVRVIGSAGSTPVTILSAE